MATDFILAAQDAKRRFPAVQPITASGATTAAADNTTAVAAAITAAGVNGSIYVPLGTFNCEGPLAPLSGQKFWGPGKLKRKAASTHDLFQINNVTDVTIDLNLDGGLASTIVGNTNDGGNGQTILAPTGTVVNCYGGSQRIRVNGRIENNQGPAVRFYECSDCTTTADIYNCIYGVVIGSASGSAGVSKRCRVLSCVLSTIGANGIIITGTTNSTINPNPIYEHMIANVDIFQVGDTGIEVGMGSHGCIVQGVTIDGNNIGYNGILIRDGSHHSISGFSIKNFPMFANGASTDVTLGNGLYFWPGFTGAIDNCAVGPGVIKNCSRGVFAEGNNFPKISTTTTADVTLPAASVQVASTAGMGTTGHANVGGQVVNYTSTDATHLLGVTGGTGTITSGATVFGFAWSGGVAGGAGSGGTPWYAANTITGVVVDGTQLGNVTGADATTLECHGFYIRSVSEYVISNCIAHDCQNDGFRIGDTSQQGAYCTNISLLGCHAYNNGQQQVGGQLYAGFAFKGSATQAVIRVNDCIASDYQTTKTQNWGYDFNSAAGASAPRMRNCIVNGAKSGSYNACGNDIYGVLGGTIQQGAGNLTVAASDSLVVYTGTGGHTATLGSATFNGTSRAVLIRNSGSGNLTIASGGGTVAVTPLAAGTEHLFISDGTNWL